MKEKKHYYGIVALIMVFWFVISFITNIIGPLIPDIIDNFNLSHLALAGFIPTSFFLAYAVISIPAGIMIDKWGQKPVLLLGFSLPLIGSLLFAFHPTFPVLLASSFTIGLGMAMLQTVVNPLTRVAGGEENFAFFSVMGQLVFGAASFVSPIVYSSLVSSLSSGEQLHGVKGVLQALTPPTLPWSSLYWLFAGILILMVILTAVVRFPKLELQEDEKSGGAASYKELLRNKYVYLFFLGILCYTATEQGVANWISKFLQDYHGLDPKVTGASVVGQFWGLMSVGCIVGLVALKLWDSRKVLKVACALALASLLSALFGTKTMALIGFPAFGFSISVMYSIVFSLALNSVDRHHGSFAGILCTAIVGGAVGPLIVGSLADLVGLRYGLLFVCLTVGYIFSVSCWAKPLVENKHKF
jgi:Fucose permease